jgi:hypothetical protein
LFAAVAIGIRRGGELVSAIVPPQACARVGDFAGERVEAGVELAKGDPAAADGFFDLKTNT